MNRPRQFLDGLAGPGRRCGSRTRTGDYIMRKPKQNHRRGSIAVLAAILMMAMLVMIAFAVDTGYVAHVRTDMQLAADASALGGANELAYNESINAATMQAAEWNNYDGRGAILSAGDIDLGYWDRDAATFTTPSPGGEDDNAVRVVVRRTAATGNEVNLFFMSIFGTSQTDVTATATAMFSKSTCGPLVGLDSVNIPGNPVVDSYRSDDGPYDPATAGDEGSICSNGPIDVTGSAAINGDANAGKGYDTTLTGGGTVTGNKAPRSKTLELPPVDASDAAVNNDNASMPPVAQGNGWRSLIDGDGNISLVGGNSVNLPAGTYYVNNLKLAGQSTINTNGKVVIYMTGDLDTAGGDIINGSQVPGNLQIYMTGGTAKVTSGVDFYGAIYAPNTAVTVSGSADLFGAVVGKTLTFTGTGDVHFDEDLEWENQAELPPRTALVQ